MNISHKSSLSQATSPEMDSGLWSRLPEELLDLILSFLPLKTFLSLRTTSKHFNSLIFSPSFVKHHSSSSSLHSPISSFILLSHTQFHHQYPLYNTILNTWKNSCLSLSPMLSCAPSASLLSTCTGLLCFSLPNLSSFLVCNLLARTSRIVKFPIYPFDFELLTLVSMSSGFKLFVISSSTSSYNTFLYDSNLQSWERFESFDLVLGNYNQQKGESVIGYLYFATPEPFSVVSFDLEGKKWERLMSDLPGELMFVRLVSNGHGKLYMIGGIGSHGISKSMKLWELNSGDSASLSTTRDSRTINAHSFITRNDRGCARILNLQPRDGGENWVEVDSVPELMCRKFMSVSYHNYEHVYCFWHQGMICVCCYNWPEILYYNVSRRTWHWMLKCPLLREKWSCGFKWFSFVPDLYASV